jgi:hypothetical protein
MTLLSSWSSEGLPLLVHEFTNRFEAVLMGVQLAERTSALVESNPDAAPGVGVGCWCGGGSRSDSPSKWRGDRRRCRYPDRDVCAGSCKRAQFAEPIP